MATIKELVDLQASACAVLGDCEASRSVTQAVLAALADKWQSDLPTTGPNMLLRKSYQDKVRQHYLSNFYGEGYDKTPNKISTIKFVRTESQLGLKDAKDYVEWLCCGREEPAFLRNLPGYVPF